MTDKAPSIGRRFLLIGAAHLDRVARAGKTFQLNASNPGSLRESVGGASFNAARALRGLGHHVRLVTARGGDAAAAGITDAIDAAGIKDAAVTWLDRTTASYTAILNERGELIAGIADMALYDLLTPRVLSRRHIRGELADADAILIDANLPAETLYDLTTTYQDRTIAAIAVSPAKVMRLLPVLPRLSALFLSRAEAASLVQCAPAVPAGEIAARMMDRGVRRAVITDGPGPAMLLDEGCLAYQVPPRVGAVQDVTGAGDTLAAATLAEWLDGRSFFEASRIGMSAASLHISTGLPFDARSACLSIAAGLDPAQLHSA